MGIVRFDAIKLICSRFGLHGLGSALVKPVQDVQLFCGITGDNFSVWVPQGFKWLRARGEPLPKDATVAFSGIFGQQGVEGFPCLLVAVLGGLAAFQVLCHGEGVLSLINSS